MVCTWLHSFTPVWIFPVFLWFFCSHSSHPCRNLLKWKSLAKKGNFYWWVLLHAKTTPTSFWHLEHNTKITKQPSIFPDWSLLQYILHFFALFHSRVTCSVKRHSAMMQRCRNPSLGCCISASLIRWLRQCQKSGQKADYIQCRARLASFGAGKIARNRGKIVAAWQYHLLHSYLCQRT